MYTTDTTKHCESTFMFALYCIAAYVKSHSSEPTETYLYDGRGSVAQVYDGSHIIRNLQYDPYGQVSEKSTGVNEYDIFYGFNSEEYNPVAETQYLRARYYTPDTGSFISRDTILGSVGNLNSQNRYTYAENDPINNTDPSGHSIAVSSYARNMAANSMIDEILIMEVAGTLMQNESKAKAAFSSQLYKAQAVSYQDIQAINSISGISQATANYYIQNGGLAALKAAISLGCVPGEIVNGTIKMFETNVNAAKTSANAQIATVKANKTAENAAWVAEQERLAEQARLAAESTKQPIIFENFAGRIVYNGSELIEVILNDWTRLTIEATYYDGLLAYHLNNIDNYSVVSRMSGESWSNLGSLLFDYAKSQSSAYLKDRTASGIAQEFRDHYNWYNNTKDVPMNNPPFGLLENWVNEHARISDVGGRDNDPDMGFWDGFGSRD